MSDNLIASFSFADLDGNHATAKRKTGRPLDQTCKSLLHPQLKPILPMNQHLARLAALVFSVLSIQTILATPQIHDELKQWHKATLAAPSPPLNYLASHD